MEWKGIFDLPHDAPQCIAVRPDERKNTVDDYLHPLYDLNTKEVLP